MAEIKNFYRKIFLDGLAVTAVSVLVSAVVIFFASGWLTEKYLEMMGEDVAALAFMASKSLKISDSDVLALKKMSHAEMHESELNKSLAALFAKQHGDDGLSYAYIYTKLEPGSSFDVVYLLDVTFFADKHENENEASRYSMLTEEEEKYYAEKCSGYYVSSGEWGEHVVGHAPFYSKEGTFVGMMGVDSFFSKFVSFRNWIFTLFIFTLLLSIAIMLALYVSVYSKYVRALKYDSITDRLTGLFNRAYYDESLVRVVKGCIRHKNSFAIIMLDIDHFKLYNDTYGHQAGDECLARVARAISDAAKRPLDLVFRYGGEEFVALLSETDADGAVKVAERIKNAVESLNIEHKSSPVSDHVTISQGIYAVPGDKIELQAASRYTGKADKALYESKKNGRNRYTVYGE